MLKDRTHDMGLMKAGKGSMARNSQGPLSALPSKAAELIPLEPHLACLAELTGQTLVPNSCLSVLLTWDGNRSSLPVARRGCRGQNTHLRPWQSALVPNGVMAKGSARCFLPSSACSPPTQHLFFLPAQHESVSSGSLECEMLF